MMSLKLADLTLATLHSLVNLQQIEAESAFWDALQTPLTQQDVAHIGFITTHLEKSPPVVMNEATIWSRAIYPLLLVGERGLVQAWAQVPLKAVYSRFELEGIADGVIGRTLLGQVDLPYLVVVETKRGTDAPNPQYQLLGAMLAAAWMNQQRKPAAHQEIFGCYTVSDTWTFVHGVVSGFELDRPSITVRLSGEYAERLQAEEIARLLKGIVARFADHVNASDRVAA